MWAICPVAISEDRDWQMAVDGAQGFDCGRTNARHRRGVSEIPQLDPRSGSSGLCDHRYQFKKCPKFCACRTNVIAMFRGKIMREFTAKVTDNLQVQTSQHATDEVA
jgi:hypothetical protein